MTYFCAVMTKNKFRIIVLLMSIALIGIVTLQFAMIRDSYVQKQQLFDQNVNAALVDVVKKVEKMEALDFIDMKAERLNKIYANAKNKTTVIETTTNISDTKTSEPLAKLAKIDVSEAKTSERLAQFAKLDARRQERLSAERINNKKNNFYIKQEKIQDSIRRVARKSAIESGKMERVYDSILKAAKSFEIQIASHDFEFEVPEFSVWSDSIQFHNIDKVIADKSKFIRDSTTAYYSYSTTVKNYPGRAVSPKAPRARTEIYTPPPPPPKPPVFFNEPVMVYAHAEEPELPKRNAAKQYLEKQKKNREEVIQDLAAELDALNVPLENRIKPKLIDSLLRIELKKRGILLDFDLLIKNNNEHKVFFTSPGSEIEPKDDYYTAVLFENVGREVAPYINVAFPEKLSMISDEMGSVLASSSILLVVLIACFAYTIQAILKQKKLSDLKNDFINNMTHEFKTPVSTILLASEALKDPAVVKDEPRVQRLAGIIYDENLRLGEHVERVLNMARMDKGEIKLAMNSVSLHNIINQVLDHMELNLSNKKQEVVLTFNDSSDDVYADSFHLKNIVQNLIDNASKYSAEGSKIFIETLELKQYVQLKVRDQGIGMKKDQVKKIFEPFYRVPTGNLHDVKGFGIGLHYVYSILKEMGGKINVKSETGLGSEFSILLPKQL